MPVAQAFAHQLHGELLLVEAVHLPDLAQEVAAMVPMDVTWDPEALSAEATAYLEGTAELLRADAPSVDTIVDVEQPLASILDAEQRAAPALLVMATHAREGLSRIVLGSVTSAVLHDGHTPVVAVPPLANHQSTATRHDDDSIGSTRWA